MSRMKSLTKILSFALVVGSALAPQTSSAQPKSPNTNSIDVRCRATNGRNNSIVFTLTNQQETLTLDSADPEFMYLSISHETPDRSQVYTNARYEIILNRPSRSHEISSEVTMRLYPAFLPSSKIFAVVQSPANRRELRQRFFLKIATDIRADTRHVLFNFSKAFPLKLKKKG